MKNTDTTKKFIVSDRLLRALSNERIRKQQEKKEFEEKMNRQNRESFQKLKEEFEKNEKENI